MIVKLSKLFRKILYIGIHQDSLGRIKRPLVKSKWSDFDTDVDGQNDYIWIFKVREFVEQGFA